MQKHEETELTDRDWCEINGCQWRRRYGRYERVLHRNERRPEDADVVITSGGVRRAIIFFTVFCLVACVFAALGGYLG